MLSNYDRALELAEKAVKLAPKMQGAWTALSSVHATLHRFDEALADLKRAEALGFHGEALEQARAGIYQATGRFAEARPIVEKLAAAWPRLQSLGALASLDADEGRIEEAERWFQKASASFSDVTPFPQVWIWFQQGLMWQKEGNLSRARELFAAAHERLPADAAVASHLAGMLASTGERERAIVLLREVIRTADDPEYHEQLSQSLRESGKADEAAMMRAFAIARYETLIKRQSAAFAEHAARFWIGLGADPKKALPLAKLRVLASRAFLACGQKELAEAQLRPLTAPAPPYPPATTATLAATAKPAPTEKPATTQ